MIVTIDDSDKENDPDDTQGTDGSRSSSVSETTKLEAERTTSIKRLYSTKQKRVVIAYAKERSTATAYRSCSLSGSLTVVALSPTNAVHIRWYTW